MLSYTVNHTVRAEDRSLAPPPPLGRARALPGADEPSTDDDQGTDYDTNSKENKSDE